MDIEEVKKEKQKLEAFIQVSLAQFMEKTGCRPDVEVRYDSFQQMGSKKKSYVPVVEVQVTL